MPRLPVPLLLLPLAFLGCDGGDPDGEGDRGPLGIPIAADGVFYAGAAVVDVTPEITETFDDLDGDSLFDGCFDDPFATREGCDEPFVDADADGTFDAVFIGGFSPRRPANGVRDPITARAAVVARDGGYVALVSLDLVGLAHPRIDDARDALEAEGFDGDALVVTSTHNHQGPDTMGLWGDPEAILSGGQGVSGVTEAYQQRVADAIVQAVKDAAGAMEAADLTVAAQAIRDRSPDLNGTAWGGRNPVAKQLGMVHDIRDPVVVSDQLLALQATAGGETLFTLTSWSGHPEVRGGENNDLSSDFVGVMRDAIEETAGGVAIHVPECLGGMQSALGGQLPVVTADGVHRYQTCSGPDVAAGREGCEGKQEGDPRTWPDGDPMPEWAVEDSWEFVVSHGWLLAEAALEILEEAEPVEVDTVRVMRESGWVPVRNLAYNLLGPSGIFDIGLDDGTFDTSLCPQASEVDLGCLPFAVWRLQIGPVTFVTAPGELLPEMAWGLPDDPAFVAEATDPGARGEGSLYFPQHDPDCDPVGWDACAEATGAEGDCDCLRIHRWPYVLADDPTLEPALAAVDTPYKAAMSNTGTYLSYIVPEPDVNPRLSLLSDQDGDHYEDTVTPAYDFGTAYLEAVRRLHGRWAE